MFERIIMQVVLFLARAFVLGVAIAIQLDFAFGHQNKKRQVPRVYGAQVKEIGYHWTLEDK